MGFYLLLIPFLAIEGGSAPLVEKYAEQLKTGKPRHRKLKKLKEEILVADPENKEGSQLQLALYKFEYLLDQQAPAEKALKPLRRYLKHFGAADPEGSKNIQLLINKYQEANQ